MKNILVPTDFSKYADYAYELACEIANKSKGSITLFHVVEYPVMSVFNTTGEIAMDSITDSYILTLKEKAESEMERKLKHPVFNDVNIMMKLAIGNPYENIATQIESTKADLVVMGTKGAAGLKEIFIGSNAEKVVRYANCPVITVPGEVKLNEIHSIAYGINFSDHHDEPLLGLKKYLELFDAKVDLVWINSFYERFTEEEATQKMQEIAELQLLENYSVNCYKGASVDDGLLYYAEEKNIDMIAMATHSRKGLAHLFAGSFTEDVVNHSSKPILVFNLKNKRKKLIDRKHETAGLH